MTGRCDCPFCPDPTHGGTLHDITDPECSQHSRGERENEFARCEVCRPQELCSSCGGSLDSPHCLRNPVTGKGGHSRTGGHPKASSSPAETPV